MPAHRKPVPDSDVLHRLYVVEREAMWSIGLMFGVSRMTVRHWLVEAGIKIRPKHVLVGGFHSVEHERKVRESRRGPNSHWWRGGVSPEAMRYRAGKEWRDLRMKVYERDGWLCQECGVRCLNTRDSKKYPKRKIQCHHIIPMRDGGPNEPNNLVTLCMSCHQRLEKSQTR